MKYSAIFFSLMFLCSLTATARQPEKEELQFLIIEALSRNPEIAAEVSKMKMMDERIPQAGALDDPQFTYKLMEFPGTRLGEAAYQNFELMQMIMFPTKLATRKDIARVKAEHAHHEHLEKIIEIIAQLKKSYAMLWNARTSLTITMENQRLLLQIISTAQTLYAVGRASQQDVLKSSIELEKLQTQESSIRQEIIGAESMLRAILNRPQEAAFGSIELGELVPVQHSLEDILQFAADNRPMIVHDSLSVREGDLMVRMSRQEYFPDFKVSFERVTMPTMGVKTWTVMAGITLPLSPWTFSKAFARVDEAQADRSMRASMYVAAKNMVSAQIREAYSRVKASEVQVRSYEQTILPQTSQSLQSLLAEYQTGKTSYLMLIDGFRMFQEMKMDAALARMKYEQAIAGLERQAGVVNLIVIPISPKENSK
ncbi:MAG TPA: hypothetical protein DCP63_11335 [Bacteroidetes bacterium]|nr:hypothetical protein [Bacteroidota bacterium]